MINRCLTVLLAATAFAAQADVLKVIVPTPPGGGTDGFFRVLVKEAEPLLNESVIINNVPGAGGTIGVPQLVRSPADGQTGAGVWLGPMSVAPNTTEDPYTPHEYMPNI